MTISSDRVLRRLVRAILGIQAVLVFFDWLIYYRFAATDPPLAKVFGISRESSIPSLFLLLLLVCTAATLWVTVAIVRGNGVSRLQLGGWIFVALFFTFLCIDDGALIHERLSETIDAAGAWRIDLPLLRLIPQPAALALLPIYAGSALVLLAFSWHFPRLRVPLILGLAGYVMALAIDAFQEIDGYVPGAAALLGWTQYSAYHYTKVVEETLELAGTTCFLYAFLGHLLRLVEGRTIRVHRDLDAKTRAS